MKTLINRIKRNVENMNANAVWKSLNDTCCCVFLNHKTRLYILQYVQKIHAAGLSC